MAKDVVVEQISGAAIEFELNVEDRYGRRHFRWKGGTAADFVEAFGANAPNAILSQLEPPPIRVAADPQLRTHLPYLQGADISLPAPSYRLPPSAPVPVTGSSEAATYAQMATEPQRVWSAEQQSIEPDYQAGFAPTLLQPAHPRFALTESMRKLLAIALTPWRWLRGDWRFQLLLALWILVTVTNQNPGLIGLKDPVGITIKNAIVQQPAKPKVSTPH